MSSYPDCATSNCTDRPRAPILFLTHFQLQFYVPRRTAHNIPAATMVRVVTLGTDISSADPDHSHKSTAPDHASSSSPSSSSPSSTRPPNEQRKLVIMSTIIIAVSLSCTLLIGMILRSQPLLTTVREQPGPDCDGQPPAAAAAAGELQTMTKASALELEQRLAQNLPGVQGIDDRGHDANDTLTAADHNVPALQRDLRIWVPHLRAAGGDAGVVTQRTFCHELSAKGQTCVFEGLMCIDVRNGGAEHEPNKDNSKPRILILNDSTPADAEGSEASTDNWCGMRHQSADPRYYSSRHWPLLQDTVVPQQSCMEARFFRTDTVLRSDVRVKWVPSLALVNLDYVDNDHNTHLAIDLMWILDAVLHDESLAYRPRPGYRRHRHPTDMDGIIFRNDTVYYLPQSRVQFERQTTRDVNRLLWAMILRKDGRRLYYPDLSDDDLNKAPAARDVVRPAKPLLDAFPELVEDGAFQFHGDLVADNETDLVCTARLTAGVKTGFSTHERVCRELRTRAYQTFDIQRPDVKRIGQINFPQPPKSILFLNRHVTRTIDNGEDIARRLREKLAYMNVPVEYETTQNLNSAEQWVRLYSSAGIVISPHGSHNMGEMFMQRYRYVIFAVHFSLFFFFVFEFACRSFLIEY